LEDLGQLAVMLAELCSGLPLKLLEPFLDRGVGRGGAAELNECAHDLDVDCDGSLAPKNP
jgi:hypothetical protein